ncbi:MAG: hypothetical protein ACOYY2_12895 [Actinomycetota bacterium]
MPRECSTCHGDGVIPWNPHWRGDPQYEVDAPCPECQPWASPHRRDHRPLRPPMAGRPVFDRTGYGEDE